MPVTGIIYAYEMHIDRSIGKFYNLGTYTQQSTKAIVSDPSYTYNKNDALSFSVALDNVAQGIWHTMIMLQDENPGRVMSLISVLEGVHVFDQSNDWGTVGDAGVDSGQLGIYDLDDYHADDEEWYDRNSNITLSNARAGIIGRGVVSRSGYGDGIYPVYVLMRNNSIVGIWVDFREE